MAHILSVQSHVAYGYVGNRAAVFPLERLGHEVTVINTVQFSNHPGYGHFSGDIMRLEHINSIFQGLETAQVFPHFDAVLTGYIGTADLGATVMHWLKRIKAANPQVIYCCDPVMGDVDRGLFVQKELPLFFKEEALKNAQILTPNPFELEVLTGIPIKHLDDARRACHILHTQGVPQVLLTSLVREDAPATHIEMLLSTAQAQYLIATAKLHSALPINGSGDATAALFLGYYLESASLEKSLEKTTASIFALIKATVQKQRRELDLIGSQAAWVTPELQFKCQMLTP